MSPPTYATLGPSGSNHDLVLQGYLARHSLPGRVLLCPDFDAALAACADGTASRLMICTAHGDCGKVVGTAQYRLGLMITDTFVATSQPLAILHATDRPTRIALHPATRSYADLSPYAQVIDVPSTVAAAQGLLAGDWDAALTATRFATDHITIAQHIAPPRDAWLILGGTDRCDVWNLDG